MSDYLPEHVLVNILTRLPIKTLLQCTCICKSWHTLIVSPRFIDCHLNRPPTQAFNNAHHLLLVRAIPSDDRKEFYSLHYDDEAFNEYAKLHFPFNQASNQFYGIVGSCNGVLCLSDVHVPNVDNRSLSNVHMPNVDNTILWNPMIRKWVRLPKPRVTFNTDSRKDIVIGFGFDAKSNDYKVVRVVFRCFTKDIISEEGQHLRHVHSEVPEIDLYSLSTGAWRNISHLGLPYKIWGWGTPVYLNGAVHWIGDDREEGNFIFVSFHMTNESFGAMSLPAGISNFGWVLSPAVIQGSLCLVDWMNDTCCIWEMKEYGVTSSWTKLFDVRMGLRVFHMGREFLRLIGFRKEGDFMIETKDELISFNPRDELVKELGVRCNTDWFDCSFDTVAYVESLVLLGSLEQTKGDEVACKENEVEVGRGEDEIESTDAAETRYPGNANSLVDTNFSSSNT